ncbi:MAG: oxidoreductase [Proteobacteria bacterium]|nr:oxidoreductase [Pseudomonadota bacterium]MDA1022382.1 oxidoreductase [Pseudomonadota bacterium]
MTDDNQFTALLLEEDAEHNVTSSIETLDNDRLPEGDVTVGVEYSTLNYKDGMVVQGLGRLVRDYPHIPGIDFAGTVEASDNPDYKPGDKVVLNGWRVGETHWGGFSTRARVKGDWLVPVPDGLSTEQCMAIGTAGYTAMLAVMALEDHGLSPDNQESVLVTGAAGGVGSIAISILSYLGYAVTASTGRAETHDYLTDLGAAEIIGRDELAEPPKGPLGKERWAGIIDSVGGPTLHSALATLSTHSSCAAVGLASGFKLETTVMPFLLRGINLLGIDSSTCPRDRRLVAWDRLSKELPLDKLASLTNTAGLAELPDLAGKILQGQVKGRIVIDPRKTG